MRISKKLIFLVVMTMYVCLLAFEMDDNIVMFCLGVFLASHMFPC